MAASVDQLLSEYARAELARFFPDLPSHGLALAPIEGPRHYRHSVFYRFPVLCDGQPTGRAALAKIIRYPSLERFKREVTEAELKAKTQEEYASLVRLHAFFSERNDPACGSVRPLGYLETANALFTEEVPAHTLRDLIMPTLGLRRRVGEAEALRYLRQSGRWLRLFHELPIEPRCQRFDSRSYLQTAHAYLLELEERGVATAHCAQLYHGLLRFIVDHRLEDREITFGWRHGDYNLRNILVSQTAAIIGFDTLLRRTCPIWEDVAIFLVELRAHKGLVLSRGRFYDMRQLDTWEQAFLAGYLGVVQADASFLQLYRALYTLRKWVFDLRVYNGRIKFGHWLGRALVGSYFSAMIASALTQPSQAERSMVA